jgi:hypothetical protein
MYGDLIEDVNSETPDESTLTRLRAKELANALSQLNKRMRCVLALRFGLDGETRRPWKKSVSGWESRASACANSSPAPYASCAPQHPTSSYICAPNKRPAQSATEGRS